MKGGEEKLRCETGSATDSCLFSFHFLLVSEEDVGLLVLSSITLAVRSLQGWA